MRVAYWLLGSIFLAASILASPVSIVIDQAEAASKKKKSDAAHRDSNRQLDEANRLDALSSEHYLQGRYAEVQQVLERALAIREKALGPDHPDVAANLTDLAVAHQDQGQYAEAQKLHERALAIREKALGPDHLVVAISLHNLALAHQNQGRYAEAQKLHERALSIRQKALGPDHVGVALSLNLLAEAHRNQGRYAEARQVLERALAIFEKELGPDDLWVEIHRNKLAELQEQHERAAADEMPDEAASLISLGDAHASQGRYAEAQQVLERALAILEKALGPDHPDVAASLNNLADAHKSQGRYAKAQHVLERALAILEKALGPDHPHVAASLINLASAHKSQERYAEAQQVLERALTIREKALRPDHPELAAIVINLAGAHWSQGRYAEAQKLHERALTIREKALGRDHSVVAASLSNLARLHSAQGRYREALQLLRRSGDIVINRVATGEPNGRRGQSEKLSEIFSQLVKTAHGFVVEQPDQKDALADETLIAAQRAGETQASGALAQMAARFGAGDGPLALAVREQQDLIGDLQALDDAIVAEMSKPSEQRNSGAVSNFREREAETKQKIDALAQRLASEFPDYAALANPEPLTIAETQKLMRPEEAMLVYLAAKSENYVWAITQKGVAWERLEADPATLEAQVTAIRNGLDISAVAEGREQPVKADALHNLYSAVVGPIEQAIAGKKHLLVVPSGALTGVPFHILVSEKPTEDDYRKAEWLVKRHAITTLPSVGSLKALRVLAKGGEPARPLIGFGNPKFGDQPEGEERIVSASLRSLFDGKLASREALLKSIPPLPATEDELRSVAKSLGVPESEIRLGASASEAEVKSAALDKYGIVYFATHGLVAGETEQLAGFAEPSLALTIPDKVSEQDDGLLTASEAAQLKLNADWVVLSACNTAAGDKPGAEALSGLARAFFYAGARALLVTHWPAGDKAAARITSDTFARLAKDPGMGRAEALRQSMLAMIEDKSDPANAYPGKWAPFVVVGEGGADAH